MLLLLFAGGYQEPDDEPAETGGGFIKTQWPTARVRDRELAAQEAEQEMQRREAQDMQDVQDIITALFALDRIF